MKALTLWQPWASLIAAGIKTHETRSWAPPASLIGQRIAVHSAVRPTRADEIRAIQADVMLGMTVGIGGRALDVLDLAWSCSLPLGAVICTVKLSAAFKCGIMRENGQVQIDRALSKDDSPILLQADPFGDFSTGRWAWALEDVDLVEPPFRVQGHQGLWNWPYPASLNFSAPLAGPQSIPGTFPVAAQE